jgi:3'-5' exonuclease
VKTYFDIETGPESDEVLAKLIPEFTAPANYKDPEKIRQNIAEQALAWKERAALSAESGVVLCIGIEDGTGFTILDVNGDEKALLRQFWGWLELHQITNNHQVLGFNIFDFDLPFLIRRSWKLGVSVPAVVRSGRYWSEQLVDIMAVWGCGNRQQTISLDRLAKYLGVGAKNGDGKDFAKLWASDRVAAEAYLENDLKLLKACSERMGL